MPAQAGMTSVLCIDSYFIDTMFFMPCTKFPSGGGVAAGRGGLESAYKVSNLKTTSPLRGTPP